MSYDWGLSTFDVDLYVRSDQLKLEKEFCTDFCCCGLHFNDLHELLEHDEAFHVSQSDDDIPTQQQQQQQQQQHFRLPIPITSTLQISNGVMAPSTDHTTSLFIDDTYLIAAPPSPEGIYQPATSVSALSAAASMIAHRPIATTTTTTRIAPASPPPMDLVGKMVDEVEDENKPYRCPVKDCDKAYKNANGLKYHHLHGHSPPDEMESKPFICTITVDCNKRYKNLNGLKYHIEHTHGLKLNLTSDMFLNKPSCK